MRELNARSGLSQPVVPDGVEMTSGFEPTARSIWPSIYPALLELVRAHRSTIVFVNNRRLAERLALRINELAEAEAGDGEERGADAGGGVARDERVLARAHHGSLAREQRLIIEEDLKAGQDPLPRRHLEPRARDRHGRGRPRDPGREPEVRRPRPATRRPGRTRARRDLEGADLPQVSRRPARVRCRREGDARGGDRGDGDPAQPTRRRRAADRRDLRRRGDRGRRPPRAGQGLVPVRRADPPAARERARHARGSVPIGRVRRAAPADRLGSNREA